jgi:hypothetical protein
MGTVRSHVASAAALALALILGGTTAALADTGHGFAYGDFSSVASLALNGDAAQAGTVLRLAPAATFRRGSAWFVTPQPVGGGFTAAFNFQITSPSTPLNADGIAFVIQNSSSGTEALGGYGEGIGYANHPSGQPGIADSLAVELDTYQNAYDPNANHVAIQSCGAANNSPDHDDPGCALGINASPGASFADGSVHAVRIEYTPPAPEGNNLVVFIDGVLVLEAAVDLSSKLTLGDGGTAWIGLTAATGGSYEDHDVLSFSFTPHVASTISLPLDPNGGTNNYVCGNYNKKLVYPPNAGGLLTITCMPVSPCDFETGRLPGTGTAGPLPNTSCIVYDGTGGNCVVFRAICTDPSDNACQQFASLADSFTSYDTQQVIQDPGYVKASTGTNAWEDIFVSFEQTRTDPTTKGATLGFSDFVATSRSTETVTIASPAPTLSLNQAVAASYSCVPALPGVTGAACTGTVASGSAIDTSASQLGVQRTLSVCGTDTVGSASAARVQYTVQYAPAGACYGDAGRRILQPINADGTSVFKAGSTVPAKFRVCDANGVSIGSAGVVSSFRLVKTVSGTTVDYLDDAVISTTPDTAFRWDPLAQQWIYNISTKGMMKNRTYYYRIALNDGTSIDFNFGLK